MGRSEISEVVLGRCLVPVKGKCFLSDDRHVAKELNAWHEHIRQNIHFLTKKNIVDKNEREVYFAFIITFISIIIECSVILHSLYNIYILQDNQKFVTKIMDGLYTL